MPSIRILIVFSALVMLPTTTLLAAFRTTVTKSEDFEQAVISRVATVTLECDRTVDCAAIERKVNNEARKLKLPFQLVIERLVRQALFSQGHTEYTPEVRASLAAELEVDALIELKIPFAERGEGFGGRRGSQVTVELFLVRPNGEILLHAVGTGRPKNVVTAPERVAGNLVERILKKAFK